MNTLDRNLWISISGFESLGGSHIFVRTFCPPIRLDTLSK
jgi:hypothetical protein